MGKPRSAPVLNTGTCGWCGEPLVQRTDEPYHNYRKRRTCNKEHAALLRESTAKATRILTPTVEARYHVKKIEKGTAEFAALTALYTK